MFGEELHLGLFRFKEDFDYAEGQDPDSDVKLQHCSLFELKPPMPGAMTKEQVESEVDLDHWKIEVKGEIYTVEVRTTLATLSYMADLTHSSYSVFAAGINSISWTLSAPKVVSPSSPRVSGLSWFGRPSSVWSENVINGSSGVSSVIHFRTPVQENSALMLG